MTNDPEKGIRFPTVLCTSCFIPYATYNVSITLTQKLSRRRQRTCSIPICHFTCSLTRHQFEEALKSCHTTDISRRSDSAQLQCQCYHAKKITACYSLLLRTCCIQPHSSSESREVHASISFHRQGLKRRLKGSGIFKDLRGTILCEICTF